jgi:hypothetical protein
MLLLKLLKLFKQLKQFVQLREHRADQYMFVWVQWREDGSEGTVKAPGSTAKMGVGDSPLG